MATHDIPLGAGILSGQPLGRNPAEARDYTRPYYSHLYSHLETKADTVYALWRAFKWRALGLSYLGYVSPRA